MIADLADALIGLSRVHRPNANDGDHETLRALMVRACEKAVAWDETADAAQIERRRHAAFLKAGLPSMLAAANKLRTLSEEAAFRNGFDEIVAPALRQVGVTTEMLREAGHGFDETQHASGPFLRKLLKAMEDELRREQRPETRRRVGERARSPRRHELGPLYLPLPIPKHAPDPKFTGLVFELAFYLRRFTAGKRVRAIEPLDEMPTYGDPCFDVLSLFTFAAIGIYFDDGGERFEKVLRSNTHADGRPIHWIGWTSSGYVGGQRRPVSFFRSDDD